MFCSETETRAHFSREETEPNLEFTTCWNSAFVAWTELLKGNHLNLIINLSVKGAYGMPGGYYPPRLFPKLSGL
jgi:hypothetical protein